MNKLDNILLNPKSKPFIIAEAGSNHDQSIEKAKELIDVASSSNAQMIKFQLFNAETLYPDRKSDMYKLFKSIELNSHWLLDLKNYCKKKNILFGCSAFDSTSLKLLKKINISSYKVGSSEMSNFDLIINIASSNKTIFLSTGMSDLSDVVNTINLIKSISKSNIVIMHCTSLYPLTYKNVNLNVINTYQKVFPDNVVGFSDHTLSNTSSIAALGLGAKVFEKHFTLNKKSNGPDHFYALEPKELSNFVLDLNNAHLALGSSVKNFLPEERKFSRNKSLYLFKNVKKGDKVSNSNIVLKSPPLGIDSKYLDFILGMKYSKNLNSDDVLKWSDILSNEK